MTLAPRGKEDVLRRIVVEYGQVLVKKKGINIEASTIW